VPLAQVIGAPFVPRIELADQPALQQLIAAGSHATVQTRVPRPDGRLLDVHVSISPVVLDGEEYRTLIVTDLSRLTRAERESRSKDEFLAMLGHELRNPLSVLQGAAHVMNLASSAADSARAGAIITRQVRHMSRLVDDLLDVGRAVMGKIVLRTQPVDLAQAVSTYVATFVATHDASARVEVETESGPAWVRGDVARLEQVVGNLLANAVKFTPRGKRIQVAVRTEGSDAVLKVVDEGAGIDRDSLGHVFDPFMQAPRTLDRSQGGLGLGLTLVRRLVELHGGSVQAESEGLGRGSTFTVRLPSVSAPEAREAGGAVAAHEARRILIVDDNADGLAMQHLLLEEHGHYVSDAADGPAALAMLAAAQPDVALIDIGLPGMDGYELARRIRSMPIGERVALVAVTGYGGSEDRRRSLEAGFACHLVKPVAPEELLRVVNELGGARPA
jgi:signal transduction histidine kinase/CheY-like chemotaxis protein